jgi:hypothetical protein
MMHIVDHRAGDPEQGLIAIHQAIRDAGLRDGGIYQTQEILPALEQAYQRIGRPEVWEVAHGWLRSKGVP